MRKKCKIFLTILIATLAISPKTYAQAITAEQGVCIGEKLAGYVAGVKGAALGCPIAGTGDLGGLGAFTMWAGLSSEAEQYLRSRAELVVLYNNFAPASQIAGRTVGRFLGEVNITDSQVNSIYGQIQSQIASNGSVNVWQGYNEPRSQGTPWDKIAEHDIQVIKATKDGGKSACVGNFKETVTSIDSSYKDAIIRELTAHGGRAYLCLHSHWNSEASLNSEIARVNSLGNFMGLSVLVTVAGYDTAAGAAAASGAGWVGNIDAATYKDQLLRFKSGTNNSGVAIFAMGMGGSWSSFDPTPLLSVAAAQAPGGCTPTPLQHIKLLSPAFNMTNLHSAGIVGSMLTTNPSVFNGLDGIAGNSYNVGYGTATGLVTDWFNKTGLHHLPVMITETGTTSGDWAFLRPELDCMQNVSCGGIQYLGASLFDLLGDGSRTWNGISFAYTGSDLIGEVCGGNCTNLGNNLAGSVSGDGSTTAGYGLTYEVGIVDGRDPSGPAGYINNLAPGVIPILRVGTALMRVGDGPSATEYGTFIKQLDSMINREVYIVAGPNEPQSECWWETSGECYGPDCGAVSDVEKVPRTIIGKITSSKVEKDAITGSTETSKPVEGTTVCVYQGAAGDKLPYYIPNFEAGGTTDENGRFVINSFLRYRAPDTGIGVASYKNRYNFLAVFCGNEKIAQIIRVDMNALQRTNVPARYADLFEGIDPRINTEVLSPIELTILCSPTQAGTGFPAEIPTDAHDPGNPHNMTDANAGLDGWQYAANPHYELRAADNSNVDSRCPQYLPYTDRRSQSELSCSGSNPRELNPVAHGAEVNFDLSRTDPQYDGRTWDLFGIIPIPRFDLLREQDQFEGKVGMQSAADPMPDVLANVMHILTGGFLTGPKKLPDNPETDGLFEVYSCEQIKESNMSYNPGSDINMQKQGLLSLLAFPYTESETGIKAMYNKANKNTIICTLENGRRVTLGEIQPYRYIVDDMANWCEPSEPPLCDPGTNPNCVEGDAGCRYVLNNAYFPDMQVIRGAVSLSAELNTTEEEVRNDHYTTEDVRKKWALGQANLDDPFDDGTSNQVGQADTCSSGSCGAAAASKIESPGSMGLTSQHAARFLLDTTDMGIYEEDGITEIQPVIGLLGPFTGFEDKQVSFTKTSHATLLNEAMCVIPQLDGHNEHSVKIAAVPKGDTGAGLEHEGQPGTFEAAFDFELECDTDHCGTEKTTAGQFYQVLHLRSPFGFLQNLFSTFWKGLNPPDSCIDEGSSTPVECYPALATCDYCDASGSPCYKYINEPNKWECDGDVPTVDSQFNVAVKQTVDMQKGFNNLNIALESFMLPSPMRVANEMSGFGIIDSQSDSELTQNNEDGFGGLMQTVKSDPSDMVDKLRELVRMPTAIYND